MQDSYKTQSSMPPRLQPTTPRSYAVDVGAETIAKGPPEIFGAVNTINEHLDMLTACIEKLAVKLGPVMRAPYPQEKAEKDPCPPPPQTELGRILGEHSARLDMSITIIRDLNERTML